MDHAGTERQDYRSLLKEAISRHLKGGEAPSARALADKIGVSNSHLSEVLSGRKSLSVEGAFKMGVRLGLTEMETQRLCLLVQLESEKDPYFRAELTDRLNRIENQSRRHDLSVDHFKLIAEWYHFAILELTHLGDFQSSASYIAQRLGISKVEAEVATDRLIRLGLIERDRSGRLRKTHEIVSSSSPIPLEAFRLFHSQLLDRAKEALASQTPGERVSATDLIPLDSRDVRKVDRLAQDFAAAVMRLSERAKFKDQVYSLSVHCTRLTRKGNGK